MYFKGFTHCIATDLKVLHQEEHVVAIHQTPSLSLQQQRNGVLFVC